MKSLCIIFFLLHASIAVAFDPAGPPPKKTVEWTVSYCTNIVVPRIDFDDSVILGAGLEFLELRHVMPAEYGIAIDGSALGEKKLRTPINLKAKDIRLLDALAKIADSVGAQLSVGKGTVSLIPKKQAESGPRD